MSDEDLEVIAVHEAGHAVVALALGVDFDRVSILPDARDGTAGRVVHGFGDLRIPTDEWRFEPGVEPEHVLDGARRWLAISTAGREANAMHEVNRVHGLSFGDAWRRFEWVEQGDREHQHILLAHVVLEDFRSTDWMRLPSLRDGLRHEGRELARQLLKSGWSSVVKLADALIEHRELSGDEVREIVT